MADSYEFPDRIENDEELEVAASKRTSAGGAVNVSWKRLRDAIECFAVFIALAKENSAAGTTFGWHVVFRCGSVAYVSGDTGAAEFRAFDLDYTPPPHDPDLADTMAAVLEENQKVWEAQRMIEGPVGVAIRQGYAALVDGGTPENGWQLSSTKAGTFEGGDTLYIVSRSDIEKPDVINLAFARTGGEAAQFAADGRTYDYLYPEVAAVFSPDLERWEYDSNGVFAVKSME